MGSSVVSTSTLRLTSGAGASVSAARPRSARLVASSGPTTPNRYVTAYAIVGRASFPAASRAAARAGVLVSAPAKLPATTALSSPSRRPPATATSAAAMRTATVARIGPAPRRSEEKKAGPDMMPTENVNSTRPRVPNASGTTT